MKLNFLQWYEREKVMLIFFPKIWMSRGNLSRSHSSMRYRQLNRPSWKESIVFIRRKCNMYLRLYNVNWVFRSWLFDIDIRVFFLSLYGSKSDQYTCLVYIIHRRTNYYWCAQDTLFTRLQATESVENKRKKKARRVIVNNRYLRIFLDTYSSFCFLSLSCIFTEYCVVIENT